MATFTGADKAIGFLFDMVANIAADYDETSTYALNDYAVYNGVLYKCTTAISTPEAFTPAKWLAVLIMDEVSAGGGGGGGTTVIANPAGQATDTLNKLQVGATIYDVPSGGGGSGHIYSTTEHIIGTWIDGSTVYERTVDFGQNEMIYPNTWYTTNISTTGIKSIIQAYGTNGDGTFFGFLGISRDSGTYCNLLQTRNAAITIRYLTFIYLKTS